MGPAYVCDGKGEEEGGYYVIALKERGRCRGGKETGC